MKPTQQGASEPLTATGAAASAGSVALVRGDQGAVIVRVAGAWHLRHGMPTAKSIEAELVASAPRQIALDTGELIHWDSSLVSFVMGLDEFCRTHSIGFDRAGLPGGLNRLIDLTQAVPEIKDARAAGEFVPLVERIGVAVLAYSAAAGRFVVFLGQVSIALVNFVAGRAHYRRSDLIEVIQSCGADALGIVTLISYLVGVILAFMGAVQLQQFGAAIYVADLVGIGIVREMGAMMTGVIMSGRTGAAFAAQLGTMKVTEEIDALTTTGISPVEFLVAPRMVALFLMMPLLCLYSDFVGILGGATVGVTMLGLSFRTYMHETAAAVTLTALVGGVFKASVYGILIGLCGCYQGFECGHSSSAVGDAATAAVVSAIVMIVVACGIFAVLFNIMGI